MALDQVTTWRAALDSEAIPMREDHGVYTIEALVNGEWRRYDPTAAVAPSRIEIGLGGALPTSDDVPILARLEIGWFKTVELAWDAVLSCVQD